MDIYGDLNGSVGRHLKNTLVRIYDNDKKRFLPAGEIGEICIFGPTLCKGYFKEEKMTARLLQMHDDGRVWLHSGDRGYLDEDGNLYFCEREKRMYVRFDGTKISPYSIENVINSCDIVKRCMVVAVKDSAHSHGKCAKAIVELNDGVDAKKAHDTLRKFFHKNLDRHMIPNEISIVKQLPYTKNGKLDYFSCGEVK